MVPTVLYFTKPIVESSLVGFYMESTSYKIHVDFGLEGS